MGFMNILCEIWWEQYKKEYSYPFEAMLILPSLSLVVFADLYSAHQWRIQDFPDGKGRGIGPKTYYLTIFLMKLHENKRNWTEEVFLHLCVILFTGEYVSQHAMWGCTPPGRHSPPRWRLKRAVCILLECILV